MPSALLEVQAVRHIITKIRSDATLYPPDLVATMLRSDTLRTMPVHGSFTGELSAPRHTRLMLTIRQPY